MGIITKLLVTYIVVIVVGAVAIYAVEIQTDSQINSPLDAVWWTVATITTVGYGDIVPESELGRIIGIIYMFFGVTTIAMTISIAGTTVYKKRFQEEEKVATDQKTILELIKKLEKTEAEIKNELKEIKDSINQNKK